MTSRDRLVLIALGALAMLGVVWLLLVSPERKEAAKLDAQVSTASAQLSAAQSQVASAQSAQARYSAAYSSIVSLGKAVPADQEVPSLMYQLAQASNKNHVDFNSIVSGAGAGASASGSAPAASSTATTATVAAAGFTQMPFTFVFNGSFADLYSMFSKLNGFTVRTTSGGLQVSGRLLTIQGVKLAPLNSAAAEPGKGQANTTLSGTITATAYVLPASQSVTGGATAASPASASAPASSGTPSSSKAASSPSSAPAAVSVAR